jgi:hypothetical protein
MDGSAFCIVSIAFVAVTILGSPVTSGRERTTTPTPAAKLNPINPTRDLLICIKLPENGIFLQVRSQRNHQKAVVFLLRKLIPGRPSNPDAARTQKLVVCLPAR